MLIALAISAVGAKDCGCPPGTDDAQNDPPNCEAPMALQYDLAGGDDWVVSTSTYDYAPSIIFDGLYKMWWCSGGASTSGGDAIYFSITTDPSSRGWSQPVKVFEPDGTSGAFDQIHTCDPSIVRANGVYYMYYGGAGGEPETTRIGVAASIDGGHWVRLAGGQPIVTPHAASSQTYGAGQPSVTFLDGMFYMTYTDDTGAAGPGQYALRSPDPTFQVDVEELYTEGFAPLDESRRTSRLFLGNFTVDWQYSDLLNMFVVAQSAGGGQRVAFYPPDLSAEYAHIDTPASWGDGPGIISTPEHHSLPGDKCGALPIGLLRAVGGEEPQTWDLAYLGFNVLAYSDEDCAICSDK